MAILHPQECWLLESFLSPEHYAATRDAIIAHIDAHEAALARYIREMPLNNRKLPLWQQADIVWGNRVMPNIRPARELYIQAYILRTHNDIKAYNIGHAMSYVSKGITECWHGWMTEEEIRNISAIESIAAALDAHLSYTIDADWDEGDLTYNGVTIDRNKCLPSQIPRYELDPSVRIEPGDKPVQTGIYLPDIDLAPARFIPANYGEPPSALQGVNRSDWVNPDTGIPSYRWTESQWAETGWTLIRRVEGEYIDVPPEGFFPQGTPEELYNWPLREQQLRQQKSGRITCWTDEPAPYAGRWASTVNGTTAWFQSRKQQLLPPFIDRHGKTHRACWSLLTRDDHGSVLVSS